MPPEPLPEVIWIHLAALWCPIFKSQVTDMSTENVQLTDQAGLLSVTQDGADCAGEVLREGGERAAPARAGFDRRGGGGEDHEGDRGWQGRRCAVQWHEVCGGHVTQRG